MSTSASFLFWKDGVPDWQPHPTPGPCLRLPVPAGPTGITQVCPLEAVTGITQVGPLEAVTVAKAMWVSLSLCCAPGQARWAASHVPHQIMEERVVQGDRCYRRVMFFLFHAVCVPGGTRLSAQGFLLRPHGASSAVILPHWSLFQSLIQVHTTSPARQR